MLMILPISNAMTLGVLMDTPDPASVGLLVEVGSVGAAGVVKLASKFYKQDLNFKKWLLNTCTDRTKYVI